MKKFWIITIILLIIALIRNKKLITSIASDMNPNAPRGIRNNNPNCIAYYKGLHFDGLIGGDTTDFGGGNDANSSVFDTIDNGIKASLNNAKHRIQMGDNTIEKLIKKWMDSSVEYEAMVISDIVFNMKKLGFTITKDTDLSNVENDVILSILWIESKWEVGAKWQPRRELYMQFA